MKIDGEHTVRFVGEPKPVDICWVDKKKFIVPAEGGYREKLEKLEHEVRTNIAVNVIDRDEKELKFKILEKGPSIFEPVITRYEKVKVDGKKIHPGGPQGSDWMIVAKTSSDPRNTKYTVTCLERTPFTKEEKELISRGKPENAEQFKDKPLGQRGLIDLDKIYDEKKAAEKLDELFKSLGESGPSKKEEKKEDEPELSVNEELANLDPDEDERTTVETETEGSGDDLDNLW
jgi:hypothetical protein